MQPIKSKRTQRGKSAPVGKAKKSPKPKPLTAAQKGWITRKANALKAKRRAAYEKGLRTRAKNKRIAAARKGWETRKKKAAKAAFKKAVKPAKQIPPKKSGPKSKAGASRKLKANGATFQETLYYETTGFIHRLYDIAILDSEDFRVDPDLIEDVIERELMEGFPGGFYAVISGWNEEGSIERSTPLLPTQRGQGQKCSDEIFRICELYQFETINKITLIFLPRRQGYDSTTKTERKSLRRIRRRGYRDVRKTSPKGRRLNNR